ncbi:MAG: N-acetyl-gamma-glutamyl-phosphate reductase [Thermoplasmatota archaeon]
MSGDKLRVGIVGASGYGGGELLRFALMHPRMEVALATSRRFAGKNVRVAHPNLRGVDLTFSAHEEAERASLDALFFAGPHGVSAAKMRTYLKAAERVFDMSADFRLSDASQYPRYYGGWQHPDPELLRTRAYGIAEFHRDEIRAAKLVSGAGCIATASIFALAPLARAGVLGPNVVVDAKVGSSAAGAEVTPGTHHPERSGVVRAYAPTGHRHTAEIRQETGLADVGLSCHAVELVRGILATAHGWLNADLTEKDVWSIYRDAYGKEPFVKIVKEHAGIYRYPEPKLVAGTNQVHVGFEVEDTERTEANGGHGGRRIVALSAIDNLARGTASAAVQNMNVAFGFEETTGLQQFALHP